MDRRATPNSIRALIRNETGAVAVSYALALTGLVAAAGVSFDFARMATMSSELHNAADQAALAAATQLDGSANAITNATTAASGLVSNKTVMANDGLGTGVGISNLTFYATYADAEAWTNPTTDPTQARFVRVNVTSRKAFYAYTPVVSLFSSDNIGAAATAGLSSSICRVPPVFMCNPSETSDPGFTVSNYIGKGLALIGNTGSTYGAGNFGWLQSTAGPGASQLRQEIGQLIPAIDCQPANAVTTEPGQDTSVLDAVNTHLDIYASDMNSACGSGTASCPSSANSRKDLIKNGNKCDIQNKGWAQSSHPYPASGLPSGSSTALTNAQAATMSPMGYPPDICHARNDGSGCTSISGVGFIGDGNWDRNAYFTSNSTNYPTYPASGTAAAQSTWINSTYGTSTPSRYQVYQNDAANAASRLQTQQDGTTGNYADSGPVCDGSGGIPVGGGTVGGEAVADRRVLTVAVIDCSAQGVTGKTPNVAVTKWVDVFLVQPTGISRTNGDGTSSNSKTVYVEVIRETPNAGGPAVSSQVVRISKPFLVN